MKKEAKNVFVDSLNKYLNPFETGIPEDEKWGKFGNLVIGGSSIGLLIAFAKYAAQKRGDKKLIKNMKDNLASINPTFELKRKDQHQKIAQGNPFSFASESPSVSKVIGNPASLLGAMLLAMYFGNKTLNKKEVRELKEDQQELFSNYGDSLKNMLYPPKSLTEVTPEEDLDALDKVADGLLDTLGNTWDDVKSGFRSMSTGAKLYVPSAFIASALASYAILNDINPNKAKMKVIAKVAEFRSKVSEDSPVTLSPYIFTDKPSKNFNKQK